MAFALEVQSVVEEYPVVGGQVVVALVGPMGIQDDRGDRAEG